jgi:MFS family permease
MVGMGFVTNWGGFMTARFFLGVTEAGLFPGVNYYLSCWYKRDEFAVRAVSPRRGGSGKQLIWLTGPI